MADPVTGPLSRERFNELVAAPYGEAAKAIRKFDPFWGRKPGEKIQYEVTARGVMTGRAIVMAATQKEADALADDLTDAAFDWMDYDNDIEIISVEPSRSGR
jgi:hypothetical protein